jgi:hypothetical protein
MEWQEAITFGGAAFIFLVVGYLTISAIDWTIEGIEAWWKNRQFWRGYNG